MGAPNVGKSSLVQALSSGTPEVCDYPFTTRSVKMGHFYVDGARHQVPHLGVCIRLFWLLASGSSKGPPLHMKK